MRMKKATDLTLEEIAKEINKDVELSLSSERDMEVLMSKIELRSQKEMAEGGNVNDNALSDSEKETLHAQIRKSIEGVASKLSTVQCMWELQNGNTMPVVSIAAVNPVQYACAPFWSQKANALYFVNAFESEIHKYDPEKERHTFAKVGNEPLSFAIPIDDFNDKFLISYGNVLGAITWDEKSNKVYNFKKIETIDEAVLGNRINAGKISPNGVLFVGTSGSGNIFTNDLKFCQASLYSFQNCKLKQMIANVSVSGGMAWDKTGHTFYFTDCAEYRIERYCYNKGDTTFAKGCILYEFKDDQLSGFPCGMTIDCDDHLWVACFNGGQVIKINTKTGKATAKIELPDCPQVTSVVFGGKNLDTLFVTSACYKVGNLATGNAGHVFQISELGVGGCPSQPLRLLPSK